MGLAKHKKLSKSEYDSLSTKDEDTIYAVNESGDFSEENLDDTAELFIGDKKIANDIPYGECNVAPSTVEKQVTTLNGNFKLKQGAKVSVKFLQGHTASTMTLNVDGTGAKNVYRDGSNLTSSMIKVSNVYDFVYDGTYWRIVGVDTNTTYSLATISSQGLMSSADKTKLDNIDLSKYLPLAGGTVTGEFKTNALTHLANSVSAVLQAFPQSEASGYLSTAIGYQAKASGNYSTAIGHLCQNFGNNSTIIGYNSYNGRRSADTSKPYITMSYFRPLSITVEGSEVYGVNIPKGESISYIYNSVEYTAENTNTTYTAILIVIQNAAKDILDVPITYASIYNSTQNYGNMRILSITEISDNIFAVVLNGQGSVLSDSLYRSYVALPVKTNLSQYAGQGGINCGYTTDSTGRFSFSAGQQSFNGSANSIINGSFNYTGGSYITVFGQNNTVITSKGSFITGTNNFASALSFISGNNNLAVHTNTKILGDYNITTAQNQTIIGNYNDNNTNGLFAVANGTSNTNRKNVFEISHTGVVYVYDNIIPSTDNKDIGSTARKWMNVYADNFKGNADTATKVNNALTIKKGSTTDTFDGSTAKTIDITDLQNIGDLENLQTSDKSNLVSAINEVNQKATNNQGGGVINDSTISPFAGFMPNNVGGIIEESYTGTVEGVVVCNYERTKFYYRIPTDAGYRFYANWLTSYLYNTTSDSVSAKTGKIFSYNDTHYIVINGTLQDISNIETTLKSYTDSTATDVEYYATVQANNALGLAKSHSNNNLTIANQYTDSQITAKIQLVPELPTDPTSGVLYLIAES